MPEVRHSIGKFPKLVGFSDTIQVLEYYLDRYLGMEAGSATKLQAVLMDGWNATIDIVLNDDDGRYEMFVIFPNDEMLSSYILEYT